MSQTKKATILLVDDEAANLSLLFEHLRGAGYKVFVTQTAADTLQQVGRIQPDLILLDIMLPDMDGFELCRCLKEGGAIEDVPIIFFSALSDTAYKVKGLDLDAVDYITKPFAPDEVIARVDKHLTIQRLQQELQYQNEHLEQRVKERTAALEQANKQLQTEMVQRQQAQAEKEQLFAVVSQQSDQLRQITERLLNQHGNQQQELRQTLHQQVENTLLNLQNNLKMVQTNLEEIAFPDNDGSLSLLGSSFDLLENAFSQLHRVRGKLNQMVADEEELRQNPLLKLTTREREILELLQQGKVAAEIAKLLQLSASSVYTYRGRILSKLEVDTLAEALQLMFHFQ